MYNYYQPQTQYATQSRPYLKGRPVSSLEEARSTAIDFDGSIFYFPDLANNRIYTKQINLDGTSTMSVFELKINSPELTTDYVTRGEFNEFINKFQEMLNQNPQQQPSQPPVQQRPALEF